MTEQPVDYMRETVRAAIECPLCGSRRRGAFALAHDIGISYRTLYRYLAGQTVNGSSMALIRAWVEKPVTVKVSRANGKVHV